MLKINQSETATFFPNNQPHQCSYGHPLHTHTPLLHPHPSRCKPTIFLPSEGAARGFVVVVADGAAVGGGDVTAETFPEFIFNRLAAFTLSFVGGGGSNPMAIGLGAGAATGSGEKSLKSGDVGTLV